MTIKVVMTMENDNKDSHNYRKLNKGSHHYEK